CEQRGARSDDDACLTGSDPLALVAAFGVAQRRMENGDRVAEARTKAADRLGCEGDLGNEHDHAAATLERGGSGLQVAPGLAAPRGAGEQRVTATGVERRNDPLDRRPLRLRQLRRARLACESLACDRREPLRPPPRQRRRDELERTSG